MPPPTVLSHPITVSNKDVTSLEWSVRRETPQRVLPRGAAWFPHCTQRSVSGTPSQPSGTMLATGAYDGAARIWSDKGEMLRVLTRHRGPIFSLKWNKAMDSLLSGSVDRTAIIWDPNTGDVRQQFEFHTGAGLLALAGAGAPGDPKESSRGWRLAGAAWRRARGQGRCWTWTGATTRRLLAARATTPCCCASWASSGRSRSSGATRAT